MNRPRTIRPRQVRRDRDAWRRRHGTPDHWRPTTVADCTLIGGTCTTCWRAHTDLRPGDPCPDCGAALVFRCPYVGCKHHLYLDVTNSGAIKLNFPDIEPWELERCCVLVEVERPWPAEPIRSRQASPRTGSGGFWRVRGETYRGAHLLCEDIARLMGVSKQRIEQLEYGALDRLRDQLRDQGVDGVEAADRMAPLLRAVDYSEPVEVHAPAEFLRRESERLDDAWDEQMARVALVWPTTPLEVATRALRRDHHVRAVRDQLALGWAWSAAELATATGLSPGRVARVLAWLHRRGEVDPDGATGRWRARSAAVLEEAA